MKLCLSIEIQEGLSYAETLALTRTAEAAGFDAALLADHYYPTEGTPDQMSAEAWIYLAALARETERIRLGTLVSPVTFRHPATLAKLAATLDRVSDGRAEVGLGAGWLESEHRAFGLPFPAGPARVDRLEEQVQILRGLWTESPFNFRGQHYRLENCVFTPRPVQQPHPTIIIGGRPAARRLPRIAARYADEYSTTRADADTCREIRALLDEACERGDRDPANLGFSLFTGVCVGATEADVRSYLARLQTDRPGYVRQTSSWIYGTPDEVAEQLGLLEAAGVRRVMLSVECDLHREMVALVGERVVPQLA